MPIDILIFALIAVFLIYRLNAILGTRHGDERQRPNPFTPGGEPVPPQVVMKQAESTMTSLAPRMPLPQDMGAFIDAESNKDGRVATGIEEIAAVDRLFNPIQFLQGARHAFDVVVTGYNKDDIATLQPLLSPKLFADFKAGIVARKEAGHTSETIIHRIISARICEAHLGGAMAYITVAYEVEETAVTRDKTGAVIDGAPDRIITVKDIWTFTRDTRSSDPNWVLIETKTAEK